MSEIFTERIQKQIVELEQKRQQLVDAANLQIAELNGRIAALSELLELEEGDGDGVADE